jgi:hypothetical protein
MILKILVQFLEQRLICLMVILFVIDAILIRNLFSMKQKFHCPRCGSQDIIEYYDSIECPKCNLEFDKEFLGIIPDEDILARQELERFTRTFLEKDSKRKEK